MNLEPELAKDAVFQGSEQIPEETPKVKGFDWNQGVNYDELLKSYKSSGFQATNFGLAVDEINRMLKARDVPLDDEHQDLYEEDEFIRRKNSCTIFFAFTSNIVSSGLREAIRFLVQHKLVDCVVTTAGEINLMPRLTVIIVCSNSRWNRGRFHQMLGTNIHRLI